MYTKYVTLKESTIYNDTNGNVYPDIFSFPIDKFIYTETAEKYALTSRDIYRFDLLVYNYYSDSNYDDVILWLNNINHIEDVTPGTIINLPSRKDVINFYRDNFA